MAGKTESYLKSCLEKRGTLLFALIDSEVPEAGAAATMAVRAEQAGASAILAGGSSVTDQMEMNQTVAEIKKAVKIPVILFPGNVSGIVPGADAIFFSSLLNSENPYFITQAQALGARSVLKYGLEPLPMAYLVVGQNTSAWFVGAARGIPTDKPKIAAAYALAARFLGMRFAYLEAGSGSRTPVTPEMVGYVRKAFDGFLIVGGGIRDAQTAKSLAAAGADALVVGTLLEEGADAGILAEIAEAARGI